MKICVVLGGIVNAGWSTARSWTARVPRNVRRLRHNPRNWPHVVGKDSLARVACCGEVRSLSQHFSKVFYY